MHQFPSLGCCFRRLPQTTLFEKGSFEKMPRTPSETNMFKKSGHIYIYRTRGGQGGNNWIFDTIMNKFLRNNKRALKLPIVSLKMSKER